MRLTLISTRQIVSSIVFFGLCTSVVLSAHAEKADSKKEMVIEADHLISDGKTNVTTCSGDVHITKGTLVVSAERDVASKTPDDFQNVKLYAKAGGKVRFRQKRDGGPDLWVEGKLSVPNMTKKQNLLNSSLVPKYVTLKVAKSPTNKKASISLTIVKTMSLLARIQAMALLYLAVEESV